MENSTGFTIFQPVGIKIDYVNVDLKEQRVAANILCHDVVKMTFVIDLNLNQVYREGSMEEVYALLPDKDEESYVEEITRWAQIFIDNKVTDPKKYFESLIQNAGT
ncbi:hypothetical protein [Jeotgalibacillus aurantiacus]|uniref:hypothetical protein n=1 Tax=Jeotgalibacillus aurantiacus TaxID=2763266 RepID=UPI001D0BBA52|nr:hypothetical protein [Jeotgalibacillus aurantiacus]